MNQRFKHILQRSLTFVASVYDKKNIYVIASIKVKNSSYDSKFGAMLLK